ncbi:hypothetical protein ACFWPQ_12130 [Streptomyces sp. NPDC058464]
MRGRTAWAAAGGAAALVLTVTSAGSWRWYFPGTTTTSRKVSAGDVLDLK